MPLYFASLNSGSNANCYYIGNENEAILVDAGLSCRETETRINRLGIDICSIKAIFISHEHKDHVYGLPVLAKKYKLPVYITRGTQQFGKVHIEKELLNRFNTDKPVQIGQLFITAFSKLHDAGDPHSFTISCGNVKVGVFTDIGAVCSNLTRHFKQCHAAFLEANYDGEMLMNGNYPFFLKQRITDGKGHLSNLQALDLFKKYKAAYMSHLILSHLSKNNNDPGLVLNLFTKHAGQTKIIVASRYEETKLFSIPLNRRKEAEENKKPSQQQLSLF